MVKLPKPQNSDDTKKPDLDEGEQGVGAQTNAPPTRSRGGQFLKGVSGNRKGKPPGARNRITTKYHEMMLEAGEAVMRKVIEDAIAGAPTALKLVVPRICPIEYEPPMEIDLPSLETAGDCKQAHNTVIQGYLEGKITRSQAAMLVELIEKLWRRIDVAELEERLERLELAQGFRP